jgi:hypothetical protein
MADKVLVSSLGNGEYRLTFPKPIKFDMNVFLQTGSHNMRLLSPDESRETIIGIEGKRETLLDWLRSLEGVDEANLKSYEESMTE